MMVRWSPRPSALFPPSSTGSVRDDEEEEDDESDPGLTLGPEQLGPPPRNKMTEGAGRRFGLFGPLMEALEEQALPPGTPHWYVLCFSVSPTAQGRGYGARLLRWLGRCADHNNVPILLETCGDRNRQFYEGSGFELGAAVCFVQNQNSKLRSADARKVLLNNY
jgi:GNAT superfamily N-acetyltransferase